MSGRFHQLVLLTAFGGAFCASAALPAGYQSCESIQVSSTGQYIDTGYKPTSATDIYAKFEVANFTNLTSIYWTRLGASGGYVSFGFIVLGPHDGCHGALRHGDGALLRRRVAKVAHHGSARLPAGLARHRPLIITKRIIL